MITNELNRSLLIHIRSKFPLVVCISDLKLQPLPYYNENSFIVGKTSCSFMLCFNCDYITRRWRCDTQYVFFLLYFETTPKNPLMSVQDFYIYSIFVCFLLYHRTSLQGLTSPKYFSSKYNDNQTFFMSDTAYVRMVLLIWFTKKCVLLLASLKCAITKVFKQRLIWFTKVWWSWS